MTKKINQDGFSHIIILLAIVVLAGVSVTTWRVYDSNNGQTVNSEVSSDEVSEIAEIPQDLGQLKTIPEVKEIAQNQVPNTDISSIELEMEDGQLAFKVYLESGKVLYINASDGSVIKTEDGTPESGDAIPASFDFANGITVQRAIEIAKNERPNVKVVKVEIELEDGVVVYSVRFADDSRVDVGAENGSINRVRNELGETKRNGNEQNSDDISDDSTKSGDKDDDDRRSGRGISDDSDDDDKSGSNKSNDSDDSDDSDDEDEDEDKDDDNSGRRQ